MNPFRNPERRRHNRVMIRIPLEMQATGSDGQSLSDAAETVAVSRCGALLRTRSSLLRGSTIVLTNPYARRSEKFRVIWASDLTQSGQYDIGVELLGGRDDFWGVRFPPAATA